MPALFKNNYHHIFQDIMKNDVRLLLAFPDLIFFILHDSPGQFQTLLNTGLFIRAICG